MAFIRMLETESFVSQNSIFFGPVVFHKAFIFQVLSILVNVVNHCDPLVIETICDKYNEGNCFQEKQ